MTIGHCCEVLGLQLSDATIALALHHLLADAVKVGLHSLALAEENRHALRHIDPDETVEVPDHRGDSCQDDGLRDREAVEVLPSEGRYLQVEFHDQSTVQTLQSSEL